MYCTHVHVHTQHAKKETYYSLQSKQMFYLFLLKVPVSKIRCRSSFKKKNTSKKHELCQYMTEIKLRLFKTACK